MLLIAFTIALGASLATGMLNVMMDVGDKVNQELKNYGANIVQNGSQSSDITITLPAESGTLARIEDVGLDEGTDFFIPRYSDRGDNL